MNHPWYFFTLKLLICHFIEIATCPQWYAVRAQTLHTVHYTTEVEKKPHIIYIYINDIK